MGASTDAERRPVSYPCSSVKHHLIAEVAGAARLHRKLAERHASGQHTIVYRRNDFKN